MLQPIASSTCHFLTGNFLVSESFVHEEFAEVLIRLRESTLAFPPSWDDCWTQEDSEWRPGWKGVEYGWQPLVREQEDAGSS